MDARYLVELAVTGALVGPMYSLIALGITLIYKSSSVLNFAQGALVMLAAYVAAAVAGATGSAVGGILAALAGLACVGVAVERFALRRMIGQPLAMVLMLTIGLDIVLRGLALTIWGTTTRPFDVGLSPEPLFLAGLRLHRIYLVGGVVAFVLMALLLLFFRSRLGVRLRAVSDDQVAAWSVGISVERAVALSWVLAGVVAAAGGVIWASVQGVDWTLSSLLVKAIAVAILGGLDSVEGVLVAGLAVGVLETLISGVIDPIIGGGSKEIVAMVIILLTILVRPFGLFGREIIERI
ncbi:MAG: branched-chain amino acid ABC transporter permease [Clostridia bacterium]|nr:branched-chain amino acid ABC transporter permease [Clostridia bacterium]